MSNVVWIGYVEVRQLPGEDHAILLSGKGAFVWVGCWAMDEASYRSRVAEVATEYGLFLVDVEETMILSQAEDDSRLGEELADICKRTSENENYCIFGKFHIYPSDN
jgi:hypothetical protein